MVARGGSGRVGTSGVGYPGTLVTRTAEQEHRARLQRAEFPWSDDSMYQLPTAPTDSSASDSAYHVPQYHNKTLPRKSGPTSPVYNDPYTTGTWRSYKRPLDHFAPHHGRSEAYSFPPCASAFSLPLCDVETGQYPRQPMPAIVPSVVSDTHVIGACGGHCPGFEYVCYYILQIIFVVGILGGISLCIAGMVSPRSNRGGDLGVLVYIGCMSSLVCAVLLGVQCCVRCEMRQRKKRANTHIPLQNMTETPAQAYPLLQTTLPHPMYRPTTLAAGDVTGVPWWRRENDD